MSDTTEALVAAVADACRRHPAPEGPADGQINTALWSALDQIGITLLPIAEEHGGAGSDLLTTAAVLQVLGQHGAAVPFAETALLGAWLLAECAAVIPGEPLTAAIAAGELTLTQVDGTWEINGELFRVPWARHVGQIVILVGGRVVQVARDQVDVRPGSNLAGEPRDHVILHRVPLAPDDVHALPPGSPVDASSFAARGALGRLALMAGAARSAVEKSYTYATERHQFGRSLFQFQSVQHQIATMAGEALLCKVAAESAAHALDLGVPSELAISAAKSSANDSASKVAKAAHQVHGAIGVTEEHTLRRSTTAIWSWREEFGSSKDTATRVGDLVLAAGADGVWPLLVGETDVLVKN